MMIISTTSRQQTFGKLIHSRSFKIHAFLEKDSRSIRRIPSPIIFTLLQLRSPMSRVVSHPDLLPLASFGLPGLVAREATLIEDEAVRQLDSEFKKCSGKFLHPSQCTGWGHAGNWLLSRSPGTPKRSFSHIKPSARRAQRCPRNPSRPQPGAFASSGFKTGGTH